MKNLTILLALAAALVGCSNSSSDDVATTPAKPGEGKALNPTGKPQTPEDQAMSDQMKTAGQAHEAGRGADAKAMAEAMKKAGK